MRPVLAAWCGAAPHLGVKLRGVGWPLGLSFGHVRIVDVESPGQPWYTWMALIASCRPAAWRARARAWHRSRQ